MQRSSSWADISSPASPESHNRIEYEVDYSGHKSPPLVSAPSRIVQSTKLLPISRKLISYYYSTIKTLVFK